MLYTIRQVNCGSMWTQNYDYESYYVSFEFLKLVMIGRKIGQSHIHHLNNNYLYPGHSRRLTNLHSQTQISWIT